MPTDTTVEVALLEEDEKCGAPEDQCDEGLACCTACCSPDEVPRCAPVDEAGACPLPDLWIDETRVPPTVDVQDMYFAEDDCAIHEGCVSAAGWRRVLKFALTTPNTGTADLAFGEPGDNDDFEFSTCHQHYHFASYADYQLHDTSGAVVATGHKQAFCLMDFEIWDQDAGGYRYHCYDQGISMGWADTYDSYLDCQFIDITDVPEGDYNLNLAINTEGVIPELDMANNVADVPVSILDPANEPPVTEPCDHEAYGMYRNCGWDNAGVMACVPGEDVVVGCEGGCDSDCDGDTVMRLCDGDNVECRGIDAIDHNDDACWGNRCSSAEIICPDSGFVTALTGSWWGSGSASCLVALDDGSTSTTSTTSTTGGTATGGTGTTGGTTGTSTTGGTTGGTTTTPTGGATGSSPTSTGSAGTTTTGA
jgi:hypothetical protein